MSLELNQVVQQRRPAVPEAPPTDALLTVRVGRTPGARGTRPPVRRPAEVLLIDHSSSMVTPGSRIAAARAAALAVLERLPDGTPFALVAGRERAEMIYPREVLTRPATPETRRAAAHALRACAPGGGTAMGSWLALAADLFRTLGDGTAGSGAYTCHALLLTDGRNEPDRETPRELARQVERARGVFLCDVIGIGDAWHTDELRIVADGLAGTARAVGDLRQLPLEMSALAAGAAARDLVRLRMRLIHRSGVERRRLAQVHPAVRVLTPDAEDRSGVAEGAYGAVEEFDLGPWGEEQREYELSVSSPYLAGERGEVMLTQVSVDVVRATRATGAAAASGAAGPDPVTVLREWTDAPDLFDAAPSRLAHFQRQQELHAAYDAGCRALQEDDLDTARDRLGLAWRLARRSGDDAMLRSLRILVELPEGPDGPVEPRSRIAAFALSSAHLRSGLTVAPPPDARDGGQDR